MSTFNLSAPIFLVDPYANVDSRYGPWNSLTDANNNINILVREKGLTVGILENGGVVEYWYKNGIQNTDLVLKTTGGGGGNADLSIFYNISSSWTSSTNTVCALSGNWNSVYSFVNQNSSTWTTTNVVTSFELSSNNAQIIDVSKGDVFFQTVDSGNLYSYVNFVTGKTIAIYLSGKKSIYTANADILHQFPLNTYFNNVGESNYLLTIDGRITKATITNINNTYYGSTELFDLNQPKQSITTQASIKLDGLLGYLLIEDGYRLLQDNSPVSPLPNT